MRTTRLALALAFALGMVASGAVRAQSDAERLREMERRLERSQQLIEQLSQRVRQLEERGAPTAAGPPTESGSQAARIEVLERSVSQAVATRSEPAAGVVLHGFADVGFESSQRPRDDGRKSGFALGNLDLFVTPSFGRVKTLAELVFEVNDEGGLDTDLERVQIGYTVSDSLTLWIGRFHTPYGYWNTAYHHGAQIQPSASRPRFIEFEDRGGILPAHTVGAWATGAVRAGGGKISYDAFVGNGNRIVDGTLDFNARRDDNGNRIVGANVGYHFGGSLDGLSAGVHALRQDVSSTSGGAVLGRTRVTMAGAYYSAELSEWESIGEYYRFRDRDLTGGAGSRSSWAGFIQLGRTLFGDLTPYYRWERTRFDAGDLYFASQEFGTSYRRHVLGLRYLLNPNTSFRIEGTRAREVLGEDRSYNEARAQFAVRF